jgi:hypothetical protein
MCTGSRPWDCMRAQEIAKDHGAKLHINFLERRAGASSTCGRPVPRSRLADSQLLPGAVTTTTQLSPSPLIRAATRLHQPFPHHIVSLNAAADRPTFRTTPHTYRRHVYRSLVSSRRKQPWGPRWMATVSIMVREAFKCVWRPLGGREDRSEQFVLTYLQSSPVYAVSTIFQPPNMLPATPCRAATRTNATARRRHRNESPCATSWRYKETRKNIVALTNMP